MTDGEPETVVLASLQKIKSIKTQLNFYFFIFIKSKTSDSFVNHFDGHFAYLKTLDFYFNKPSKWYPIHPHTKTVPLLVNILVKSWLTPSKRRKKETSPNYDCTAIKGQRDYCI